MTESFALGRAAAWLQDALLGSVATVIGIVVIAALGMLMMQGRLPWRRGAMTVFGCFLVFGAPVIARGLLSASSSQAGGNRPEMTVSNPLPPIPAPSTSPGYDPYAGASVPNDRR